MSIYHDCFSPSKIGSFHSHRCWFLYSEVSLSFLLIDGCKHLFRSLLTLEVLWWVIVLSPYIIVFKTTTMASFHPNYCWLLYFEVFLWFLFVDDFNHSLVSQIIWSLYWYYDPWFHLKYSADLSNTNFFLLYH